MRKIIIDCDNTFGIAGCDVDDGLAILYALGSGCCEVLGVTTTFGNSSLDEVYPNTIQFMQQIGAGQIPVLRGGEIGSTCNDAADFMVEMVRRYPGEVSVLATGSLTNLYHAALADPEFLALTDELSLMGGTTKPLVINGRVLGELNFSCSHEAALHILTQGKKIKIATGNNCMDALFTRTEFDRLKTGGNQFLQWMHERISYWFDREAAVFGHDGIYKWDVYAAAELLSPQFFTANPTVITPDSESIRTGSLVGSGAAKTVSLPVLKDPQQYMAHVYSVYEKYSKR